MNKENNASQTGQEHKKVIVVAEDDMMYKYLLLYNLNDRRYGVKMFGNGRDAMYFMNNNRFDLLITGLNMPLINGLELIWHVRKVVSATVPIIAMSTTSEERVKSRVKILGATCFMEKPFLITDLATCITSLIEGI